MGQAEVLKLIEKNLIMTNKEIDQILTDYQNAGIRHALRKLSEHNDIINFKLNVICEKGSKIVRGFYVKNDLYQDFFGNERQKEDFANFKGRCDSQRFCILNNLQKQETNKSELRTFEETGEAMRV